MKDAPVYAVLVRENPRRFVVPTKLYTECEEHLLDLGFTVLTVECQLGERPFELADRKHITHVGVRHRTILWHKENLTNIGVAHLPPGWKYLLCHDADVLFHRKDIVSEIKHALQQFKVVQTWDTCYDLGPGGSHMELHRSFMSIYAQGKPIVQGPKCGPNTGYTFAHPGYSWAYTRDAYVNVGGLIDTAIAGAADHHMALALIGRIWDSIPHNIEPAYAKPMLLWQEDALRHIHDRVGYVPGTISHPFHGSKQARNYIGRWQILIENDFDPAVDLKKNEFGVWELRGNKPRLTRQLENYMASRNEDANCIL